MARTIDITAEERNEIWSMAEMSYGGALEVLVREASDGRIEHGTLAEVEQWLSGLDVLGLERDADVGCAIPLNLGFAYFVEAAERQALEVLTDSSATFATTLKQASASVIAEHFLPPAEGDTEGGYLVAYHRIKAVRERMEAAEPGLRCSGPEAVTV
jgi:hypothetical protein